MLLLLYLSLLYLQAERSKGRVKSPVNVQSSRSSLAAIPEPDQVASQSLEQNEKKAFSVGAIQQYEIVPMKWCCLLLKRSMLMDGENKLMGFVFLPLCFCECV